MTTIRTILVICGLAGIVVGAAALTEIGPDQAREVGEWALGAVLLHDGVAAVATLLAGAVVWRLTARLPTVSRQIVMAGLAISALLSLIAWPLIVRRDVYPNPTVTMLDYGTNLLWLIGFIAVSTVVAAVVAARVARRRRPGGPR